MSTALKLLERDGVLAGLNLSEVAKEVGVTPANVYHFFGSRQGLLREALAAVFDEIEPRFERVQDMPRAERLDRMFRFMAHEPRLRQLALLSLDGADGFLFPFLDVSRETLRRDVESGSLDAEADAELVHAMMLAAMMGFALFREPAAKKLGIPTDELDERAAALFRKMAAAFEPST